MIGKTVSHYKITRELGSGGMGVVYEAVDTKLDRTVALKFLPPESTRDPDAKARFVHEAKAASAIDHPNVCNIYEIDETEDGQLFLAMACYEGETLKDRIERGPLPLDDALDITCQVAEGLTKAHQRDIIHRDIKPANIFITDDGVVKILDFGLAKLGGLTRLTQEGTTLGTAHYMSPEQVGGQEVDHRSDLWCLGVCLYEMITGRVPFQGDHPQAVTYAILNSDPEPVTGLRTGVPLELERIVNKNLAKEPRHRYQHAADLLADLSSLEQTMAGHTSPVLPPRKGKHFLRRVPLLLGLIAVAVVIGLLPDRLAKWKDGGSPGEAEPALAVVDFRDLATPGDPNVSAGISELVNIGLVENCPIRVVSPELLRDIRRRLFGSGRGVIEDDQVIEVARKSGATLLLAGHIGEVGERGFVTWRLVDTRNGESVKAKKVEGDNIMRLADAVIAGVLPVVSDICGIEVATALTKVGRITTASPEAYDHFVTGMLSIENSQWTMAREEWEIAVGLDSTFALAHLELGNLLVSEIFIRDVERGKFHLAEAEVFKEGLSERDRLRLDAAMFNSLWQPEKAKAVLTQLLKRWPDDRQALRDYIILSGRFWDGRGVVSTAERYLDYFPDDYQAIAGRYAGALRSLGRSQDALRFSLDYSGRYPDSPDAWDELARSYLACGLPDSAAAVFAVAHDLDPNFGRENDLATCAYSAGDLKRAILLMERFLDREDLSQQTRYWELVIFSVDLGLAAYHREAGQYNKALLVSESSIRLESEDTSKRGLDWAKHLTWLGRPQEAMDILERRAAKEPDSWNNSSSLRIRTRAMIALGDLAGARTAVDSLRAEEDRYGAMARKLALKAEAEIALAEQDPATALDILDQLIGQGLAIISGNKLEIMEAKARALRMLGRFEDAAKTHEDLLRVMGGHALSHFALGEIFEEMGRLKEAENEYGVFLDMWSEADEGLPQLEHARNRLAFLQSRR